MAMDYRENLAYSPFPKNSYRCRFEEDFFKALEAGERAEKKANDEWDKINNFLDLRKVKSPTKPIDLSGLDTPSRYADKNPKLFKTAKRLRPFTETELATIEMLQPYDWNVWATMTFKSRLSQEEAINRFKKWLDTVNRKIYGRRYKKSKGKLGATYAVSFELQPCSQHPHFHFILGFPPLTGEKSSNGKSRTYTTPEAIQLCKKQFKLLDGGRTQFDEYKTLTKEHQTNVLAYLSKGILSWERLG